MKQVLASFVACSILVHAPAVMAETNSYFYDALGRLLQRRMTVEQPTEMSRPIFSMLQETDRTYLP